MQLLDVQPSICYSCVNFFFVQRKDKLKAELKKRYPQLTFDRPARMNMAEIVYADSSKLASISKSSITMFMEDDDDDNIHVSLSNELDSPAYQCSADLMYCGKMLRNSIDHHKYQCQWPPSSETLTLTSCEESVPPLLYNFIALIVGESEATPDNLVFDNVDNSAHAKILSICQDVISLRRKGRNPCPKSLSLGITLKHLTGSAHLISVLNSLGHSVSYDSVNRAETAIANNILRQPTSIPNHFSTSTASTLVFDNIDFTEETLSGAGTTHHVNGILYQNSRQARNNEPIDIVQSTPISKRSKSLRAQTALNLEPFVLGKRIGFPADEVDRDLTSREAAEEGLVKSTVKDFTYLAVKTTETSLQPGWTGFNKDYTHPDHILPKSNIHYIPVIEASPNDLATVAHVLNHGKAMADDLQLPAITVVFDQALYSKAQTVRWKDKALQEHLFLRLGEFHTCMAFLGSIGKLYKHSGIEDILMESDVLAGGSVNGVISGHMYNRSVRCHKILYEALSRLQLQAFLEENPDMQSQFDDDVKTLLASLELNIITDSELRSKFSEFVTTQAQRNSIFRFWNNYLIMVGVLLHFIRATRESDWVSHINSLRLMLPYFYALDRQNYARFVCKPALACTAIGLHIQLVII